MTYTQAQARRPIEIESVRIRYYRVAGCHTHMQKQLGGHGARGGAQGYDFALPSIASGLRMYFRLDLYFDRVLMPSQ